jgi:hypothetical protein
MTSLNRIACVAGVLLSVLDNPAEARWKPEYASMPQEVRDWYQKAELTPKAQLRFAFEVHQRTFRQHGHPRDGSSDHHVIGRALAAHLSGFFGALGAFRDPPIVQKRLALLLGNDFDVRELRGFWGGDPDLVDMRYDFVKKNYDALAAKLPERSSARLIRVGSDYCDDAHRAEVESTFRARAATGFGGERVLEETLEAIDLCIASRKAQQESVESFLRRF